MTARQEFSKATRLAAWQRAGGRCQFCTAKLFASNVEYHHHAECTFGGSADLDNCVVVCRACHGAITSARAPVIAKSTRVRNRHIGIRKRPHRWGYGRADELKKKLSGEVVRRSNYDR